MSGASPIQRHERSEEDAEIEATEDSMTVNGAIYDKVYEAAEKFAGTYVGQYATGKVDRLLKLIEDTAKWSLPQSSQDKNDSNTPLERPLPWIPFIAMILMLRMIRLSLSIGGLFIGNAPLVPGDVVYFIQTRRRKLRAIRIVGMRDIRRKEQAMGEKQNSGIVSKLRSLLSVVVCRTGQGREVFKSSAVNQNSVEGSSNTGGNETTAKADLSSWQSRQAESEDVFDHDLTLDQIIDKYGGASSDNDSDFIPPNDAALNDDDTSSQSTSSASSEDDDGDENEADKSKEDANPESDAHMTNGNRRSQLISSSSTEIQPDDRSMVIKENGEHFSKSSRRPGPVPLPKPYKQETVPAPIQEIKQEPVDSDDDTPRSPPLQQDPAELKRSTEPLQQQHQQQQQSVVARNDENVSESDGPKENCFAVTDPEEMDDKKVNGDDTMPGIDPASGSPNLTGNFVFQPTSILKNANAVHLETRGPAVDYTEDDTTCSAEKVTESHATSPPINTTQIPARGSSHYTAKHNKNKFRGKRR